MKFDSVAPPLVRCQIKSCMGVMNLALTQGMVAGWASTAITKLKAKEAPLELSTDEISWVVSSFDLGIMVGALMSSVAFALAGRRLTVFLGSLTLTTWMLLTFFGRSAAVLILARLLGGFGHSIAFSFAYIYIGEVSSAHLRGPLITTATMLLALGETITFIVSPYVDWGLLCLYPAPGVVLVAVSVIFQMKETPFYLIMRGRQEDAEKSLRALRVGEPEEAVRAEMDAITRNVRQQREDAATWSEMFSPPGAKRATALVLVLMTAAALAGITGLTSYTNQIFVATGSQVVSESTSSALILATMTLTVLFGVALIERLGRRVQLSATSFINALCLGTFTAFLMVRELGHADTSSLSWLPLVLLIGYVASAGVGANVVPQVLMSELLDQRAKVMITPLCMILLSTFSFSINNVFPRFEEANSYWIIFLFFTCTNVLFGVFTLLFVPETKGKTLVEVYDMLRGKRILKERL